MVDHAPKLLCVFQRKRTCRYLRRDRDAIYGRDLVAMTKALGNGRGDYRTAFAMAKSVSRAADRFGTARMFRPRHRVE